MANVTMHELRTKKVMTEQQIEMFNDLLNNADFKGKKTLRHLLWLNTVAPKFTIGDVVEIRGDGLQRIWDRPVRRAVGKVKEITVFKTDDTYYYAVECTFQKEDGKQYTTTVHGAESNVKPAQEYVINTEWSK